MSTNFYIIKKDATDYDTGEDLHIAKRHASAHKWTFQAYEENPLPEAFTIPIPAIESVETWKKALDHLSDEYIVISEYFDSFDEKGINTLKSEWDSFTPLTEDEYYKLFPEAEVWKNMNAEFMDEQGYRFTYNDFG